MKMKNMRKIFNLTCSKQMSTIKYKRMAIEI
jgi:hypothetical protein